MIWSALSTNKLFSRKSLNSLPLRLPRVTIKDFFLFNLLVICEMPSALYIFLSNLILPVI